MESSNATAVSLDSNPSPLCLDSASVAPFAQEWITITKQQYIELEAQAHYWQSLHSRAKVRIEELEQERLLKEAEVKDLQNRLFGKKSEKQSSSTSRQSGVSRTTGRNRG